jgi:outer membrane protein assembly factor BamB
VAIDRGYSSPVLTEFEVYLTTHRDRSLFTLCLERDSGELRWEREAPAPNESAYRGPNTPVSSTPAADGENIYVLFPTYGAVAYDSEGEELWRRPLGPFNVPHTLSTSPVVAGDSLVILADQDTDSFLAALDTKTGEIQWQIQRPRVTHSYSSPVVHQPASGGPQILVSGAFQLCSYNLDDGEKLWWADGMSWQGVTLPVIAGDRLYVHSAVPPLSEFGAPKITETFEEALQSKDQNSDGKISKDEWPHEMMQQLWFIFDLNNDSWLDAEEWQYALARNRSQGGLFSYRLGGAGDITQSHQAWVYADRRGLPDYASPLVVGETLFTIGDGGVLTAIDCNDGKLVKQGRVGQPDKYFASLVAAGDRILAASQSGQLTVIDAQPQWEELASHSLDEEIWATPAVAGNQVVVRSVTALYCFSSSPVADG